MRRLVWSAVVAGERGGQRMRTGTTGSHPGRLEGVRQRFEGWRRTRQGRSRIPEGLWALAVKAAERYGLYPTVQALGLDYYSLKRRLDAAHREPRGRTTPSRRRPDRIASTKVRAVAGETAAQFIELAPPAFAGIPECILELEDWRGACDVLRRRRGHAGAREEDWRRSFTVQAGRNDAEWTSDYLGP
jgi:hypothetical protein